MDVVTLFPTFLLVVVLGLTIWQFRMIGSGGNGGYAIANRTIDHYERENERLQGQLLTQKQEHETKQASMTAKIAELERDLARQKETIAYLRRLAEKQGSGGATISIGGDLSGRDKKEN